MKKTILLGALIALATVGAFAQTQADLQADGNGKNTDNVLTMAWAMGSSVTRR
jgi:hypothetical protein